MTGILLGLSLLIGAGLGWIALPVLGVAALALLSVNALKPVVVVACLLAALIGVLRISHSAEDRTVWPDQTKAFRGVTTSGAVESGSQQHFVVAVSRTGEFVASEPASGRLCVTAPLAPVVYRGDVVYVSGAVTPIDAAPTGLVAYMRGRNCSGLLQSYGLTVISRGAGLRNRLDRLRRSTSDALYAISPGDRGALLSGLVTGDDGSLSSTAREGFYATGTSHITAISGSNLALVLAVFAMLAQVFAGRIRLSVRIAALIAIWVYVAALDFNPPSLRAAIVATLAFLAVQLGRKPDLLTLSVLVAAGEVVWRPGDFDSLAYRLSTVSAIAITLAIVESMRIRQPHWLRSSLLTLLAVQVATAPFLAWSVGLPSVWAIPANLLIAPLVAVAFPLGLAIALVAPLSTTLASGIGFPAQFAAQGILSIVGFFAGLSGAGQLNGLPVEPLILIVGAGTLALSQQLRGGIVRIGAALSHRPVRNRMLAGSVLVAAALGAAIAALIR